MKKLNVLLLVAALCAFAGSAVAAETADAADCAAPAPALDDVFGPSVMELAAIAPSEEADPGDGSRATCVADCQHGPDRVCSGSSCWAQDQNCSANVRGRCWGSSTGYRNCNICPTTQCTVTANCANAGGGTVSCTGDCGDVYKFDDCYAYCDGHYHMCPSPPGPCPF
ncbi:MAG: hypothetical protein AAGD06_01015 [Acidobacteriota bacterium]